MRFSGRETARPVLSLAAAAQLDSQFQGIFAMWYRRIIFLLKLADEFGMIDDDHVTLVW